MPVVGMLHENIPTILAELESKLSPVETTGRLPLGLPHIDKCVTVGRQNLRFVGIVGMSGDGKTTLTNQVVYNWLSQGAHILYCSTEHTPKEIWEFMAFLHASHPDYPFTLPPLQDWEDGLKSGMVTRTDQTNVSKILNDIQSRKNLPGLLDVQQFRDWDTITDHLKMNQKRNRYDVLVVDYLARLEVPGDPRFRDEGLKKLIHEAQALSRTFDANRGLVVLTPIQVNREAHKAALRAEESEARYNLNAISSLSEYQHDLDLCLSVFSNDDMKEDNQVEIQCLKKRKGRQPGKEFMQIDPGTGAFSYQVPAEIKDMWNRTVDDMTTSTGAFNATEWGI